jgi:FkbM family methyltransferase
MATITSDWITTKNPKYGYRFTYAADDTFIGKWMAKGVYEEVESALWASLIRPDSIVLDIGACIGHYTLVAAGRVDPARGRVYAFEPQPETFELLDRNIALNGFGHARAIHAAVGAEAGRVRVYRGPENWGGHEVYASPGCEGRESAEVELLAIDDFLEAEGVVPTIVKMDVEGFEYHALRGMRRLLDDDAAPLTLLMEFFPAIAERAKRSTGDGGIDKVYEILDSSFTDLFWIDPETWQALPASYELLLSKCPGTGLVNLLCVRDAGWKATIEACRADRCRLDAEVLAAAAASESREPEPEVSLDDVVIRLIEMGHGHAAVPVIEAAVQRLVLENADRGGHFEYEDLCRVLRDSGQGRVVDWMEEAVADLERRAREAEVVAARELEAKARKLERLPRSRDAEGEQAFWVFCAGMMRSGSTVQYQLVQRIVESSGRGEGVWYCKPQDFPRLYEKRKREPKTFVMKCHNYLPWIDELVRDGRAVVLYTYRDLRDAIVSYMRVEKRSFEGVINEGWLEQRLEDDAAWYHAPGVHRMRYEDWISDLEGESLRIAALLGIDLSKAEAAAIAEEFGFEAQRARLPELENRIMYPEHVHSGESGQWRHALSVEELDFLESVIGEWLLARGYEPSRAAEPRIGYAVGNGQITVGVKRRPLPGIYRTSGRITAADRERMLGYAPFLVWLVGPAGPEKAQVAEALERELLRRGVLAVVLDPALLGGVTDPHAADPAEEAVRAAEAGRIALAAGAVAIAPVDAPRARDREAALSRVAGLDVVEVRIDAAGRDGTPGGESEIFEPSAGATLRFEVDADTTVDCARKIIAYLEASRRICRWPSIARASRA